VNSAELDPLLFLRGLRTASVSGGLRAQRCREPLWNEKGEPLWNEKESHSGMKRERIKRLPGARPESMKKSSWNLG
jgi:hypothetical protein